MVHIVTASVNVPEKYAVAPGTRKWHSLGGDSMPTTFDAPAVQNVVEHPPGED